ncbi:MAG: methyl-accepting chemotaxis protein [Planctomycetes bacterium]|nr:methyl-accepting chemotaxis protein [Planctomycetota bacterium]
MKIGAKLTLTHVLISVIPVILVGIILELTIAGKFAELEENAHEDGVEVIAQQAQKGISDKVFDMLEVIQKNKTERIDIFFSNMATNIEAFAKSRDVAELFVQLREYHVDTKVKADGPYDISTNEYKKIWSEYGSNLVDYNDACGYNDIYMVCTAHGHVMYTVKHGPDMGANLYHGSLKGSGLAQLCRKVAKEKKIAFVDYSAYEANDNLPTAFMGFPVYLNGAMVGMIAIQLPATQTNAIVQDRTSLYKSGESYLVGKDSNGETSLRSERIVKPAVIGKKKSGKLIDLAIQGESGQGEKIGSTGAKEFIFYSPVAVCDTKWALVTTVAEKEVLADAISMLKKSDEIGEVLEKFSDDSVRSMRFNIFFMCVSFVIISLVMARLVAGKITRPIIKTVEVAKALATGDMTQHIDSKTKDETGELAAALNKTSESLSSLIGQIQKNAQTLTTSSGELASVSTQLVGGSEDMSSQSQAVAGATEEMTTNITTMASAVEEMSVNTKSVSDAAGQMTSSMSSVTSSIDDLNNSIAKIGTSSQKGKEVALEAREMSDVANKQ